MKAKNSLMGILCLINKLLKIKHILAFVLVFMSISTQISVAQIPNYEPLKIGEKVPDIEFAIKNYHSPTAKISDFKGKLLILDFWTTYCASCIHSFPKMEKLQKQYGDKIQILLVNVRENEDEIVKNMKKRRSVAPELDRLPSIVGSDALEELFPHRFAGNYFWIDGEGILRMASPLFYNHHDEKINDVINGKAITFLDQGYVYLKGEKTLADLVSDSPKRRPALGSMFTDVIINYVPVGGQVLDEVDTVSNTIRNTYVNRSVLSLYNFALNDLLNEEWKSKVYGPNLGTNGYLDHFLVLVKDSALYDNRFIPQELETDINMVKGEYCYEQVLPLNTSKVQASEFMVEDLDRFFRLKYGAAIALEEVNVPCYLITRSAVNPLNEKEIRKKLKHLGKREFQTHNYFDGVVGGYFRKLNIDLPYVFDVDKLNKKMQVILPVWEIGDSLEDFTLALDLNGLNFIKVERKMKMIVVRDNQ